VRPALKSDELTCMIQLSGQCGILNIEQMYGPPHSITEIDLHFFCSDVRTSQETYASIVCYGDSFIFLNVDDVRTSEGTYISTTGYGDRFAFSYVDHVRSSQET
jgi:hypothetical protein